MSRRYRVAGHVEVTVTTVIEFDDDERHDEEEILSKAKEQFGGVKSYAGNGGRYKLVGISDKDATMICDEEVEFDDFWEED